MKISSGLRRHAILFAGGRKRAGGEQRASAGTQSIGVRGLLRSGDEGGALIETALVLPILLMVLTGMFSLVIALYNYQQLGNATITAAQQLGAGRGLITDPCAAVAVAVAASLPNWAASKFTYTLTVTDSAGAAHKFGPTGGSGFSCTTGGANMGQNEPVTLMVSYQYTWLPAFGISNLAGNLLSSETVLAD
jgi:Flp pilus assembly protein TadG